MTDNPKKGPPRSNRDKEPADWVTGEEPMTGAQQSYLKTLTEEAGEVFEEDLTKAEASERIDALKEKLKDARTASRSPSRHRPG